MGGTLQGTAIRYYALPGPLDSITFRPGDSAAFTIPGAAGGFATSAFSMKTAEPFTVTSVPTTPPAGLATLNLKWTPPPVIGSGSVMLVSLRYARAGISTPESQVSCVLTDSGGATLSDFLVTGWYGSTVHQAAFNRLRTTFKGVGGDILAGLAFTSVKGVY